MLQLVLLLLASGPSRHVVEGRHFIYRSQHLVLHQDCGRQNAVGRVSVPDAGIDNSPAHQRQWGTSEFFRLAHPCHSEEHPEIGGRPASTQRRPAPVRHLDGWMTGDNFDVPVPWEVSLSHIIS